MATYRFRAKAINGSSVTGVLDADGRDAAFTEDVERIVDEVGRGVYHLRGQSP